MTFTIHLYTKTKQDISSFSPGWFEITSGETTISFYKNRLCMAFMSLSNLIKYLSISDSYKDKKYGWDGVDNSYLYHFRRNKSYLEIYSGDIMFTVLFEDIKKAVIAGAISLLQHAQSINPAVVEEAAYLDVQNALVLRGFL